MFHKLKTISVKILCHTNASMTYDISDVILPVLAHLPLQDLTGLSVKASSCPQVLTQLHLPLGCQ